MAFLPATLYTIASPANGRSPFLSRARRQLPSIDDGDESHQLRPKRLTGRASRALPFAATGQGHTAFRQSRARECLVRPASEPARYWSLSAQTGGSRTRDF